MFRILCVRRATPQVGKKRNTAVYGLGGGGGVSAVEGGQERGERKPLTVPHQGNGKKKIKGKIAGDSLAGRAHRTRKTHYSERAPVSAHKIGEESRERSRKIGGRMYCKALLTRRQERGYFERGVSPRSTTSDEARQYARASHLKSRGDSLINGATGHISTGERALRLDRGRAVSH